MSSSQVIRLVSELLKDVLEDRLQADFPNPVILSKPADLTQEFALSVWLYHVTPNAYVRAPKARTENELGVRFPLLEVDLYYLLTPYLRDETSNQLALGRVLQVLNDNSVLLLDRLGVKEELHLSIFQRSFSELAEIWEALQQPYRLSVCLEVRTVEIDSDRFKE